MFWMSRPTASKPRWAKKIRLRRPCFPACTCRWPSFSPPEPKAQKSTIKDHIMAQHPDHQAANQPRDNVLPVDPHKSPNQAGHASASTEAHRAEAPDAVRCHILTVSDTRTEATDRGGALIRELLEAAGHRLVGYQIVRDEMPSI